MQACCPAGAQRGARGHGVAAGPGRRRRATTWRILGRGVGIWRRIAGWV